MAARPGHQRDVIVSGPPDTRFDVPGSRAQCDTGWHHSGVEVILSRAGSTKPRVSGAKQRAAKTSPERSPIRPSAPPGLARSRPGQARRGRSPSRSNQQLSTSAQCVTTGQISIGRAGEAHTATVRVTVATATATTIADSPFVTARAYRSAGEATFPSRRTCTRTDFTSRRLGTATTYSCGSTRGSASPTPTTSRMTMRPARTGTTRTSTCSWRDRSSREWPARSSSRADSTRCRRCASSRSDGSS